MGLCFNVLGSGSSGNSTLISDGPTNILVDNGFSYKEITRRLGEYGLPPEKISAIVVSHEHGDHCDGVELFVRKQDIPVFMMKSTFDNLNKTLDKSSSKRKCKRAIDPSKHREISPGENFEIGSIGVTCFSLPHNSLPDDPVDTLGFVFEKNGVRVGIATDLGHVSNLVIERLKGCAGIVLESNHDVAMLKASQRSWEIKQRILGKHGHLSNAATAEYLTRDFDGTAAHVVLAHLSTECNLPDLALLTARRALQERPDMRRAQTKIEIAYPDKISKTYQY